MFILLDIDGVLETTPSWRKPEIAEDGFMKLNTNAVNNLAKIIAATSAAIVLTTTHRINYNVDKWKEIFNSRGIFPAQISIINNKTTLAEMGRRSNEIEAWVTQQLPGTKFVVIDDDLSLNGLPHFIKNKCIITSSMIGLDEDGAKAAIGILLDSHH